MAALRLARFALPATVVALGLTAPSTAAQADAAMQNPSFSPDENPVLPGQTTLGKFLFWEEQMSFDNTMACGTCHIHEAGGSDPRATMGMAPGADGIFGTPDDVAGSPGVVNQTLAGGFKHENVFFPGVQATGRKTPSSINAGPFSELFWDGRAQGEFRDPLTDELVIEFGGALESQAAGPPLSLVEMGAEGFGWADIADKISKVRPLALATDIPDEMVDFLAANPTYPDMFEAVYGTPDVTPTKIIFAIANYERTLVSDETVLDQWLKGEITEFPPEFQEGFDLFQLDANCTSCHVFPNTSNGGFHNIGVRPDSEDAGRQDFTGSSFDTAKFKTPNVRNSKLRVPLFHNGGKATVRELVEFYNIGGDFPGPNLDENLVPLNLTESQIDALTFFIEEGMTDPRVENRLFPFTRPTLRSELGAPNAVYGVAQQNGNGDTMTVLANSPAATAQPSWLLGVADATPNQALVTAFSFDSADGSPLPDIRYPIPMNIDVNSLFLVLFGTTDSFGTGTVSIDFPKNPALVGLTFFAQSFVTDPAVTETTGVYGSEGVEVTIF